MNRRKYKLFVCVCVLVYIYYNFGIGDYIFSKNFDDNFNYPLNVDLRTIVKDVLSGEKPGINPINYYPYRFLTNSGKCSTVDKLDLFIAVKSAVGNFQNRNAIRQTFGQENHPGRIVKTLFFLGIDGKAKSNLQKQIDREMAEFKDIIQIDFIDDYYNNTIKTMMSFRWLYEHCSSADYYLFTDDDMYISVSNLLNYVQNKAMDIAVDSFTMTSKELMSKSSQLNALERDGHLYAGYVFESSPQRFRSSKWRVSLDEYPWNKWPPYVTAGAYVISNKTMKFLYIGSLFVKHFRFDDIYLGIVAKKLGITLTHCPDFYFYKKQYSKDSYTTLIASHGYGNHDELIRVWGMQNNFI